MQLILATFVAIASFAPASAPTAQQPAVDKAADCCTTGGACCVTDAACCK